MGEAGTIKNNRLFFCRLFVPKLNLTLVCSVSVTLGKDVSTQKSRSFKREDYGDVIKYQSLQRSSPLLYPFSQHPGQTQDLMISESRIAN